jgi:hypothetical protein
VAGRTSCPRLTSTSKGEASEASTKEDSGRNVEDFDAGGGAHTCFDLSNGVLAEVPADDLRGVVESRAKTGAKSAACVDLSKNKVTDQRVLGQSLQFKLRSTLKSRKPRPPPEPLNLITWLAARSSHRLGAEGGLEHQI